MADTPEGIRGYQIPDTATEADMTSSNFITLDGAPKTKKLPSNVVAKASVQKTLYAYDDITDRMVKGSYIATNVSVGNTVSYNRTSEGSFSNYVLDVSAGDIFRIRGIGGNTPRLWCFVDSSDKVVSVAGAGASTGSAGLELVAPSNGKIIINMQYQNTASGVPYFLRKIDNQESKDNDFDFFQDNSVVFKNVASEFISGSYIKTNGGLDTTVSYTPVSSGGNSNYVCSCSAGDKFHLKGQGGDASRLWCFVDSSDKILSVAAANANASVNEVELVAPYDGKLIVNVVNSTFGYFKIVYPVQRYVDEQFEVVNKEISKFDENSLVYENVGSTFLKSQYVKTNVGVGNVVDFTPISSGGNSNYVCSCSAGDKFYLKGQGGDASRLWCFVDSSDKVVSVAAANANASVNEVVLVAPVDGKLVVNVNDASFGYFKVLRPVQKYVEEGDTKFDENSLTFKNVKSSFVNGFQITTNVGLRNSVDFTPVASDGVSYYVYSCRVGDKFYLKGQGGDASRLWCFVDSSDKVVSVAAANANASVNEAVLVAPVDGKLIVNVFSNSFSYFKILYPVQNYIDERFADVNNSVSVMQKFNIIPDGTPFSGAGEYLGDINFSGNVMEQVYEKFDELVSDYPDFMTKYDAAELLGIEYPRYANGISSGDLDYLETPAYKTYAYKLSNINASAGNTGTFKKKKLLIVGGVHGVEYLASANLACLAKHFLDEISNDLFTILSLFDIWFVPCVNGYGLIHVTRVNANGVDINRNFGTSRWAVSGQPGDYTYTGSIPDSEFETRLIEGLYEYVSPNFFVDHHCTPSSVSLQFYSETFSKKILDRSYNSLVEISRYLIKNYPQYFGRVYQLFIDTQYTRTLPRGLTVDQGLGIGWFCERGVESATIEILGHINYQNGEYVENGPQYTAEHFEINEFTLRNQLVNYLPIVLT